MWLRCSKHQPLLLGSFFWSTALNKDIPLITFNVTCCVLLLLLLLLQWNEHAAVNGLKQFSSSIDRNVSVLVLQTTTDNRLSDSIIHLQRQAIWIVRRKCFIAIDWILAARYAWEICKYFAIKSSLSLHMLLLPHDGSEWIKMKHNPFKSWSYCCCRYTAK